MTPHREHSTDAIRARLAEHELSWDRIRDRIAHASGLGVEGTPGRHLGPYLAVGGHPKAGQEELAGRVGTALGWQVVADEVVDLVAEHLQLNPTLLHLLDDRSSSWVTDVLGEFWPHEVPTRDAFVGQLKQVVQLLAMHGDVVFVGHGAGFFLPPQYGLHVKLVMSDAMRIDRIRASENVDEAAAHRRLGELARRHEALLVRALGHDGTDPRWYDLVLNSARQPIEVLADVVVAACRRTGLVRDGLAASASSRGGTVGSTEG
ncbi:MAG: cytidylate kinase-like family protein [Acidobacteria bacterium]|jgi:hypothetical protein|nr:cytidylate kinase-like family protein [Acidobacteriota bacterium]